MGGAIARRCECYREAHRYSSQSQVDESVVARDNTASFQSVHLGYSTSGSTGSFICPAMAVTEGQLAVRRHLRLMNEDRMASFDAQDIEGYMKMFLPDAKLIIRSPRVDPIIMEGYEAIKCLQRAFMDGIKGKFGRSFHELCEWEWEKVSDTSATCRVYCKLWLTDKASGLWKQRDLAGKSGRFWLVLNHVRLGNKWMLETQTAESED